MAQLVRNLSAMQETWVWSLGWEDPLEKGTATYSSVWPGELVHGAAKSGTRLSDFHFTSLKKGEIASDQWSDASTWISDLQAWFPLPFIFQFKPPSFMSLYITSFFGLRAFVPAKYLCQECSPTPHTIFSSFFKKKKFKFWLLWVFIAVQGLSLFAVSEVL